MKKKKQYFENTNSKEYKKGKKSSPKIKKSKIKKKKSKASQKKSTTIREETKKILTSKPAKQKKSSKKKGPQIKKSFKKKKSQVKVSYLWWLFFGSVLILMGILLLKHPESIKTIKKPSPQQLQTIQSEEQFLKIKDALLSNSRPDTSAQPEAPLFIKLLNKNPQQTALLLNDKYLAILKRGKIFIVNRATSKYTSKLEISPIPKQEKEAVLYQNIFSRGNILLISGYRRANKSLEITTFKISPTGLLTRGMTYDIPSNNYLSDSLLLGDKLIMYTSRKLLTTTFGDTSIVNTWDKKTNKFIADNVNHSKIFFNNNNLTDAPLLHSFTVCQLREDSLINCQQKHLMDDKINSGHLDNKNIYLWITQELLKDSPQRIVPSSRLYKLPLDNDSLQMIQVEGSPLNKDSLQIIEDKIKTSIYQNNNLPPTWHREFTNGQLALNKISLDNFKEGGNLIIDRDEYSLLGDTFNNDSNTKFISLDEALVKIDLKAPKIIILTQDHQGEEFNLAGDILLAHKIADTSKVFILLKSQNRLYATILDVKSKTLGEAITLKENLKTEPLTLEDEFNSFILNNELLISVPIVNTADIGTLFLLSLKNDELEKIYELPFKKTYQSLRDNCQNSCQQDWKNLVKFFPSSDHKKIYALTGSYLKSFYWNKLKKLQLAKTINYTVKPAPPKPKRPPARIPVGAKVVNGKYVCKKKHDYVGKSKSNNKGYLHLDMECCLDPDEYPNPWCTYRPGELKVTKLRYANYHGRVKRKKK